MPDGPPPKTLQIDDITEGDGAEAKAGDTLTMQYVGVNYSNGKQFDASWDNGQPFTFQLGAGSVIPGWDQGIQGMKVGGRRELIIPPDLGYGAQGSTARHRPERDARLHRRPARRPAAHGHPRSPLPRAVRTGASPTRGVLICLRAGHGDPRAADKTSLDGWLWVLKNVRGRVVSVIGSLDRRSRWPRSPRARRSVTPAAESPLRGEPVDTESHVGATSPAEPVTVTGKVVRVPAARWRQPDTESRRRFSLRSVDADGNVLDTFGPFTAGPGRRRSTATDSRVGNRGR